MSDADELEREAEAARARLSDTADQIRARMSPGQLMDEVLNQFRGGDGSQMLANLRGQARDNPMALALVGSGLAWLMMGSGGGDAKRGPKLGPKAASYPATGTGFGGLPAGGCVPGSMRTAITASDTASEPGSGSVAGMAQGASDALGLRPDPRSGRGSRAAGDRAHRLAGDLRSAGSDALGGVRASATGAGYQARDTFFDILDREPLVIGAIGLAVGAAIGAFLPATEAERQHLGPAGEALKQKADALVDRGIAKAKEAAAEVYETARDEADRQGLVPGDKPIAAKIDAVVRAAGRPPAASLSGTRRRPPPPRRAPRRAPTRFPNASAAAGGRPLGFPLVSGSAPPGTSRCYIPEPRLTSHDSDRVEHQGMARKGGRRTMPSPARSRAAAYSAATAFWLAALSASPVRSRRSRLPPAGWRRAAWQRRSSRVPPPSASACRSV